ncbi:MAG: hypothetical protein NC429_05080 [Lachnospiraceae bacterium]|nr:hypothetical protein [Lachnospiraceae bacterium]
MNEYTVKEPKIVLFIGLPYTIFFLGLYALSMIYAVWYCADFGVALLFTLLFGSVSFPGIYLIVSYFRRRLIINGTQISYTPAFGSARTFSVSDVQVITLDAMTSVKLRSPEGKRLACFELNMAGSCAALSYLESQNIPVVPSSSLASRLFKTGKRNNS